MAVLSYVTQFDTRIRAMYGHDLVSDALFQSNPDIEIRGAKEIKLPKMTVSGYKDHNRGSLGFNTGSYSNEFETKQLDHDRDIEFQSMEDVLKHAFPGKEKSMSMMSIAVAQKKRLKKRIYSC